MYWLEGQRYRLLTRLGIFGRTIDLLGLLSPTLLAGYVIYSAHGSLLDLSFDKVLGKPSFNARLIVALLVAQLAAILRRIHISRRNRSSGASHALPSAMRPFSSRAFAIDGDTLAAGDIRIRIHGMDAPETEQSGGPESRQHLQSMIDGKILDFVPLKIDRYNRTVATVYCAGVDIGEAMVRDGYAIAAYASRNKLGDQLYAHAEQEAKATRAGLWGRLGAVPSPESFRHAG